MKTQITVADTPDLIEGFRLIRLKFMLKLELKGMKCHGPSAYAQIKRMGFRGNKQRVYDQYVKHLREKGIIR